MLALCAGSSLGQLNVWRWQNPLPVGNFLRAVQMVSMDTIYVCGDGGSFMRSIDQGQTWEVQNGVLKNKANFNSLSFLDPNYGMVCGDGGRIVKTTNGGNSWIDLATGTKIKLNSILVVDKNISVAVTHGGQIIRTSDGGSTWLTIPVEINYELFSVRKLHPDFLTITGYGGTLLISTDQGLTWPQIPMRFGNTFYSTFFSDTNNGTMIGEYGLILHTSDGGVSWDKQMLEDGSIISASLNVVDGKDPNVLAIAGDYGILLFTTNGGVTWNQSYIGTAEPIKGLSFFDRMTATAVGRNGVVLHTTDGGATWEFLPHRAYTDDLHSVAFPKGDTSLGLAVGNNGTILRTSNGGKIWTLIPSGFTRTLYGVCFMDSVSAIAVGEFGRIIKSSDAGLTWNPLSSGTLQRLYGVSFSSPNSGIAVGDSGIILTTNSAGLFWTRRYTTPPTFTEFFTGVSAPDSLHAYICGEQSVYKTIDGGLSWDRAPGASSSRGQSISFADSLHGGFVYGDKYGPGYTRCTSDGGIIFDSVYPGTTHVLLGISFSDRKHVTVAGAFGYIAHSTDAGRSWVTQESNTVNNLNAVSFGTIKAGTAVGFRGNIMRITTNEILAVHDHGATGSPKPILDPCYPNPATGATTISYFLPGGGFASVKIYTTNGKEIATLAGGFMQAGEQQVQCDVSSFASGSYLIRLEFGGVSVSRRLTVIR